ncbi:MAG TPA: response regulator, partial [Desulfomonilia bacterium]|nr:response regulator [Desulfomonilia bacterium]
AVRDGIEAFKLFSKTPEAFDLVITDLTMPQITGVELANKLMDIRADIPIILCTGFNDAIDEEEARQYGIKELILKPASTSEIKSAVSRVLES